MSSLSGIVEEMGGKVELQDLPTVVREPLAPFDRLGREFLQHHEGVEFCWVRSPDFWAAAGDDGGRPTIAMAYGTALALEEAFMALFSIPALFTSAGEASAESPWVDPPALLGVSTEISERGRYWRQPRAPKRKKGAHLAASIAQSFVLSHELAHIRRSHIELLDRPFLADGPALQTLPAVRMFEVDADYCGAVDVARSELLSSRRGAEGPLVTAIFSVGLALSFLDRGSQVPDHRSRAHAHPLHRLFLAVDAFSAVLARRIGLDRPTAEHCRHKSYVFLHHCAELLGRVDSAWHNVDADVWLTGDYQEERSQYFEWERDMVESGRIPRVIGCPSDWNLSSSSPSESED